MLHFYKKYSKLTLLQPENIPGIQNTLIPKVRLLIIDKSYKIYTEQTMVSTRVILYNYTPRHSHRLSIWKICLTVVGCPVYHIKLKLGIRLTFWRNMQSESINN